jgi:hypothetical protein
MKRRSAVRGASGGKGTLNLRVLTHMPLVPLIAEQVCRQVAQPLDLGNLTKDGIAGLIEAARIYTPQSSVPFGIYVKHRIKGAILDGLLSGTASPRPLLSERRCLPHTQQMRTGTRSVGTGEAERGDEILQSLFRLQRSLEYSENTADRVKLPSFTAKILPPIG